MHRNDPNFCKLAESETLIAGHVFEYAYLINRVNREEIYLGSLYGDPSCALISTDNNWCLVGGEVLILWKRTGVVIQIEDNNLCWIKNIRQISAVEAEILIDPWSEKGAVWKLNIETLERHKVKTFKLDGEYSHELNW